MQDLVDGVGVVLAGAEAIDGLGDVLDELAEARLVVGSDQRPIGPALTLRSHVVIVPPRGGGCLARARAREQLESGLPPRGASEKERPARGSRRDWANMVSGPPS